MGLSSAPSTFHWRFRRTMHPCCSKGARCICSSIHAAPPKHDTPAASAYVAELTWCNTAGVDSCGGALQLSAVHALAAGAH